MKHIPSQLSSTMSIDGGSPQYIVETRSINESRPQSIVIDIDWLSMDNAYSSLWQAMPIDCYRLRIICGLKYPSMGTAFHP